MYQVDGLIYAGSAMLLTLACLYKQQRRTLEELMKIYSEKGEEFWVQKWRQDNTGWHLTEPHPDLVEYLNQLESETVDGTGKPQTILIPLCGKCVDILYLYKKGFTVVGIELVEKPLVTVLEEAKINYTVTFLENGGKLFESKDRRIRLVATSIFNVELITKVLGMRVDFIWDRASLIAINPSQRMSYAVALGKLRKENAKTLLSVLCYNQRERGGPPWSLTRDMLEELFPNTTISWFAERLRLPGSIPPGISQAQEVTYICEPISAVRSTSDVILVGHQRESLTELAERKAKDDGS